MNRSCELAPTKACYMLNIAFIYMSVEDMLLKNVLIPWRVESGLQMSIYDMELSEALYMCEQDWIGEN